MKSSLEQDGSMPVIFKAGLTGAEINSLEAVVNIALPGAYKTYWHA